LGRCEKPVESIESTARNHAIVSPACGTLVQAKDPCHPTAITTAILALATFHPPVIYRRTICHRVTFLQVIHHSEMAIQAAIIEAAFVALARCE